MYFEYVLFIVYKYCLHEYTLKQEKSSICPFASPNNKKCKWKNPQNRYSVYVNVGVLYEQNESIHKLGILTDPDTWVFSFVLMILLDDMLLLNTYDGNQ